MTQTSTEELGKLLGRGATAEIYEWKNNQVLKLFNSGFRSELIEREANKTRLLHEFGHKVPAVGDLVEVDGRLGLPLERIVGVTMQELIIKKPWLTFHYWRMLVELQLELFDKQPIKELPPQRKFLEESIRNSQKYDSKLKEVLLESLSKLPDGESTIHYDFHPGNILIAARGPIIIDWLGAFKGNPLAEVARTWVVYSNYLSPDVPIEYVPVAKILRPVHRQTTKLILKRYLKYFFELRPGGKEELKAWIPIIAAVALNEGSKVVEKIRMKMVQDAFPAFEI